MQSRIAASLGIAFALLACVLPGRAGAAGVLDFTADSERPVIYMYRTFSLKGSGLDITVWVNDEEIGFMESIGEAYRIEVLPGKNDIWARDNLNRIAHINLDTKAGKNYFISLTDIEHVGAIGLILRLKPDQEGRDELESIARSKLNNLRQKVRSNDSHIPTTRGKETREKIARVENGQTDELFEDYRHRLEPIK